MEESWSLLNIIWELTLLAAALTLHWLWDYRVDNPDNHRIVYIIMGLMVAALGLAWFLL